MQGKGFNSSLHHLNSLLSEVVIAGNLNCYPTVLGVAK
jgi:hypothetical protein